MNHRIWSSLSVTLLTTTLGTATAGYAQQTKATSQGSEGSPTTQVQQVPATATLSSAQSAVQSSEVVKVGELQSRSMRTQEAEVIAKIHSYELQGRQVATLYVRSIPVLTFLGSQSSSADGMKIGQAQLRPYSSPQPYSQKTPSNGTSENTALMAQPRTVSDASNVQNDAVWRATAVAAKLNQLSLNNVPADAIAVRWQPECNCYSINVNNQELVQINNRTFLPDTTQNLAMDALQATNRLRRLMGNAPPLQQIIGMPVAPQRPVARVAVGPVRVQITGMASWYGPGFHGNQSASGEIYNQNAMTAAHRSLPFGTKVQVTNLDNGRSAVVRINDRGPYVGNRVIDLSAAAARVLGVMQTGIAPVRLDILDNAGAVATQR